jgi:hypothetical protein
MIVDISHYVEQTPSSLSLSLKWISEYRKEAPNAAWLIWNIFQIGREMCRAVSQVYIRLEKAETRLGMASKG